MNRRRARRGIVLVAALVALCLCAADAVAVLLPRHDPPGQSDALVVLGPSVVPRTSHADALMRRGAARALVVSAHPADIGERPPICDERGLPYPVYCFDPSPSTTQGEARGVAALARQHGWSSIQVITFDPQVERARLILGRCFTGPISMLKHDEQYDRVDMFVYQSAGLVKASLVRGC